MLDFNFSISIQGNATPAPPPPGPVKYVGYRVRHRTEGGRETPDAMPCVNPSINIAGIDFDKGMQLMSFSLANGYNANVTKKKWRVVYNGGIAFTNGQGFDDPRAGPRADWVNMVDLDKALPRLMKAIICSGNFFTGQISGNELIMTPGVDAIDGNQPMPPIEQIMKKHWYFHATTASFDVNGNWKVSNFPQGGGAPVLVPYILKAEARYPISWFVPWNEDYLPDPLKIYL